MNPSIHAALDAAGASFGERFGRTVAREFGDAYAEFATLRSACGLLDAGFRRLRRVTGADRTTFVQGMVSNDVVTIAPGGGTAAAILTVQGRVVTDLRVYVLESEIWLDFPAHREATGVETLSRYVVADDVEFEEPAMEPLVILEGRTAAEVFSAAFAVAVETLPRWAHIAFAVDGAPLRVFAVTHSGEPGFLVAGAPDLAGDVWRRALAGGARPVGSEALEIARVEAGIPLIDVDMDESYLAPEVGLADAISHRKGCYIGQEVVERVASRGNVQKKLVGLRIEGDTTVAARSPLLAEGNEVGTVTSCVASPDLGIIALAYARRAVWDVGTRVAVAAESGHIDAVVAELPFVDGGTPRSR